MREQSPAPFSFHCIICFDPFNLVDRPPVVLPCGHTYVCEPCSKRLNKCMECRTSLFMKPPPCSPTSRPTSRPAADYRSNVAAIRYSPNVASSPKKPPVEQQIPLPLPKNVVMISLMEAAARHCHWKKGKNPNQSEGDLSTEYDEGNESGDDDEMVMSGINAMTSACGTYVVRERNGLIVQPTNPNKAEERESMRFFAADTSKTLKLCNDDLVGEKIIMGNVENGDKFMFDSQPNLVTTPSMENFNDIEKEEEAASPRSDYLSVQSSFSFAEPVKQPTIIEYGQKVQVVDIKSGVARLARNQGYIIANSSQLVKVGEPLEKACEIEGMMNSVIATKADLERQLKQMERLEENLSKELDVALSKPEEHPVIEDNHSSKAATIYRPKLVEDDEEEEEGFRGSVFEPKTVGLKAHSLSPYNRSRYHYPRPYGATTIVHRPAPAPVSPVSPPQLSNSVREVDSSQDSQDELPSVSIVDRRPLESSMRGFRDRGIICGSSLFPGLEMDSIDEDDNNNEAGIELNYKETTSLNPILTSLQRNPRRGEGSTAAAAAGDFRSSGLDFRTGLSGHLGLSSAMKHERARPQFARGEIRMMSEHRGIASIKPIRRIVGNVGLSPRLRSKKTW